MNEKLISYIKQRFSQKANEGDIIEELKKTGWGISDINIALAEAKGILPPPRPLPGPGELLKESFLEYRKKYKFYLTILILPVLINLIPLLVFTFFFSYIGQKLSFGSHKNFAFADAILNQSTTLIIGFSIWIILALIVNVVSQAAILYTVTHPDEKLTVVSAYKKSFSYIWSLCWVGFISGFLMVGGMSLFVVPGILFWVWFAFATLILFDENIKGSKALLKSKSYVQKYFWPVFGRMLFMILISLIIGIGAQIIIGTIDLSLSLAGIPKEIIAAIGQIASSIVNFLLGPLWLIYWYTLYKHVKNTQGENTARKQNLSKIVIVAIVGWLVFASLAGLVIFASIKLSQNQYSSKSIDILAIQTPLTLYFTDNGKYPANLFELTPKYINELPKTFSNPEMFRYTPDANGQLYTLCTIENGREKNCVDRK